VSFGANDDEVCVFSDFGLRLSIFNLTTSRSIDISSPKFYNPAIAQKGLSYRPITSHLALLTRSGGKDIISIHAQDTLDVVRSWWPETVDTQGIAWIPDGRWLVVWESPSQGHRVLIYTADGHLFKAWNGPMPVSDDDIDASLGAGIKLLECSPNGCLVAVGDLSRRVIILSLPILSESIRLLHPTAVKPAESLQVSLALIPLPNLRKWLREKQVWQEQITHLQNMEFRREFVLATQTIYPPPTTSLPSIPDPKTGTNILTFDRSSTLLATRVEDMASTIWIWDINTRVLRAVLILHAPVAKATWHPSINELLMVRCEGEENRAVVHLWDPSWNSPKIVDFNTQIPGGKVLGKTIVRWLNVDSLFPVLFFSDTHDYMFASLSGVEDGELPWEDSEVGDYDSHEQRDESPLNLVPAKEKRKNGTVSTDDSMDDVMSMSGGSDELEDTFQFRKFVAPKDNPNSWT